MHRARHVTISGKGPATHATNDLRVHTWNPVSFILLYIYPYDTIKSKLHMLQ